MPDVRVVASEKAFKKLFDKLVEKFVFEDAGSADLGPFTASYDIKLHLEGGSIDLRQDNTVQVKELDIKWDRLNLSLGVDIPELCVGGFCIVPIPFDGCLLEAPRICVFSDNPDIEIMLPLGGLITSEISITGTLFTKYFVNLDRPADMDQWDAQNVDPKLFNKWQLFLNPQTVDVDIIDIADTVGDLLDNAIEALIDVLLGGLPDWAKDLIKRILGSIVDLVRRILDIGDDIQEWITDLLDVSLGLLNLIGQVVGDYFAKRNPLFEVEDPYPIMEEADNPNNQPDEPPLPKLLPVKMPIRDLTVFNNDVEMVLEGNVG
jgi:hypothetical protein